MSKVSCNTQVVFLVDVSTRRQRGEKWEEAICLCILRIMCFFSCQILFDRKTKTKQKSLKWGYKLFDIDGQYGKVGSVSPTFKDFKLKYFEQFERDLKNVTGSTDFNVSATSSSTTASATQTANTRSKKGQAKTKKRSTVTSFPALCLSKCLTETLHDFPWEMPDIGSPVKTKKTSKETDQSEYEENSNHVFLISRVPCDQKALRHYSNKIVLDKTVFTESIMSQMLQKEFIAHQEIKLYWIDAGQYQPPSRTVMIPPDKKSYKIVEQSLKTLKGALVPFHALVTYLATPDQRRHFAQVSPDGTCSREAGGKSGKWTRKDKVAVLLSSFACASACSAVVPCIREESRAAAGRQKDGSPSVTLVINGQESDGCVEVAMQLVPIVPEVPARSGKTPVLQELQLESDDGIEASCCLLRQGRRRTHQAHFSAVTQLKMRACIDQTELRQLTLNVNKHYVCKVADNVPSDRYQAFSSLLRTIYTRHQTLVLTVKTDQEPLPQLALLEALSPGSAHLSYLSLALTLQVEKLITLRGQTVKSSTPCVSTLLQAFKDRAVKAIMAQNISMAPQRDQGSTETVSDGHKMWTGMMNPWHVTGSVRPLQQVLDKLADRVEEMQYLSDNEKAVLLTVQQAYRREGQAPFLWDPSRQSTPLLPTSSSLLPSSGGSGERGNSSGEDLGCSESRGSAESSLLTRGQLMVSRARSAASSNLGSDSLMLDEVDGDYVPNVTADAVSLFDASSIDVKSEEDLSKFVQEQYEAALETGISMETTVQSLVTVTLHFMTSQENSANPQESTVDFLRERILKSSRDLKTRYQNSAPEEDSMTKIIELKLQILLRMEMESVCTSLDQSDQDQSADQIVELLRSLLFATNAGEMPDFLSNTILTNYLPTLPQLLVTIYDELMQPLPLALAPFASPESTPSVSLGPLSASSHPSVGPGSVLSAPAGSNQSGDSHKVRTRSSLRAHPSLTSNMNKRQIVVQKKVVKKPKGETKRRMKTEHKSPARQHKARGEVKKARRNLFNTNSGTTGSVREDSERKRTPKKKKKKRSTPTKKSRRTPVKKHGGSKTMVIETPRHHQRSHLARQREQVAQQLSTSGPPDVQVIAESPMKEIADLKSSPGRYKPARRVLRQSFYAAGKEQRSRNLDRAVEQSDVGQQHHHRQLRANWGKRLSEALTAKNQDEEEEEEEALTPKRQAAAFLRSQLIKSPSPGLDSPSRNTRSRTPQRYPRQRLFDEGLSLPVWSSAVSVLDFSSPGKQSSTSTTRVVETPPKARRQLGMLVADTPTKEEAGKSPATPGKTRPESSGQVALSLQPAVREDRDTLLSPKKGGSSKNVRKELGLNTPQKREASHAKKKGENKRTKKIALSQSSSSSSSSQQSSILDYVSPVRGSRAGQTAETATGMVTCTSGLSSPAAKHSPRLSLSQDLQSGTPSKQGEDCGSCAAATQPRLGSSYAATPTKTRHEFLSPTKTPTKPILKNSPFLQRSQSAQNRPVRTPQKSPRVTFDLDTRRRDSRTPSPSGESVVKTPDSMDKWPRRKRRRTSDPSKSPSSVCCQRSSGELDKTDVEPTNPAGSRLTGVGVLHLGDVVKEESTGGTTGFSIDSISRKPSSVFSETDMSSPCKRSKIDNLTGASVTRPTSFSEDAMDSFAVDSYFSAINKDVFLGSSDQTAVPSSSTVLSEPNVFTGQPGSPKFNVKLLKRVSSLRSSSSVAFEGSQGFDVGHAGTSEPSPSPTFSTSPSPKPHTKESAKTQSSHIKIEFTDFDQKGASDHTDKKKEVIIQHQKLQTLKRQGQVDTSREAERASTSRAAPESQTPIRLAQSSPSSSHLTPLRVKGTPTGRVYSPNVSTNSLVHLMSSPLLLDHPKRSRSRLFKESDVANHGNPTEEQPKKKQKKTHQQ